MSRNFSDRGRREARTIKCALCETQFDKELFADEANDWHECATCLATRCHNPGCANTVPQHQPICLTKDCQDPHHPDEFGPEDGNVFFVWEGHLRDLGRQITVRNRNGQHIHGDKLAHMLALGAQYKHLATVIWEKLLYMSYGPSCKDCGRSMRLLLGRFHYIVSNLRFMKGEREKFRQAEEARRKAAEEKAARRQAARNDVLQQLDAALKGGSKPAEAEAPSEATPPVEQAEEEQPEEVVEKRKPKGKRATTEGGKKS